MGKIQKIIDPIIAKLYSNKFFRILKKITEVKDETITCDMITDFTKSSPIPNKNV